MPSNAVGLLCSSDVMAGRAIAVMHTSEAQNGSPRHLVRKSMSARRKLRY